ncbi:PREDICTED: cytochrome P450 4ae1 isoform X2 [Rhagoletis zephyria]|nr:PREDICTED: cytochrome P450 4ae1 isoform X2 [Rhagoletis zephyria]XP_017473100.1 PREDICTED: cytochrome P450 4ae1 isoform X2 [Rhagoletis zephyria]XP_017473102.1 PREDICTED: cytochrome P450 4ae1 isoform X2 [Rhagoletis zephyria]XP_017473103.1 PREDICTED: cytochrome P450 4ae1 isoform X2 [Rhagoletis zephyria]XP_017473104.1 PREDICTED: cytochrome P450 4ae1 isoform X2 [Rhagoletis zephyria]XP_017473105.1 PREDICTED: cytochrome P450 4ae1 isoform X2 [Rhagoletis zephyria]XP_036339067.1 cytochrome P450 4ae1
MFLELLLAALLFISFYDYYIRMRNREFYQRIPLVSKIPLVGCILVLARFQPDNLHLKFQEFVSRFGKSFCAPVLRGLMVVTADPRYVEELLSSQKHIQKNQLYWLLRGWLGNGLLLSQGRKWQTMRKIITPAFHFKILEQFVDVFERQSRVLVDKLAGFADGKTPVDIYPYMGLMTLDVIAETAMGVCLNAQHDSKSDFVQAVKDVTNIVATRFIRPILAFPRFFKLLRPQQYEKQMEGIEIMHRFTETIITERRMMLQNKSNLNTEVVSTQTEDIGLKPRLALLDVLLQATTTEGQPLTDDEIRDEVNTFMFEGHDTTTSAISFCLYLLSRHADCQCELFEELRAHFGDDTTRPIKYCDLQNLSYLNCVIKEALRIYPPIPVIGRWLKEELVLPDVTLPPRTNVLILLWQILRDPDVYDEPERFWPQRHLTANARASAFSHIPFSAGPRNCVGQRFALNEMRAVIVQVLRYYELLPMGPPIEPSIKIVLRSKTGVNIGLQRRTYV